MTAIITTHSCMTLFFHLLPLSTPLIYAPGCVGRDLCVEEGITLQYVPLQSSDDDDDDGSASLRYVLLMFSIDDNIKLGDPLHRTDCWPVSTILTTCLSKDPITPYTHFYHILSPGVPLSLRTKSACGMHDSSPLYR